MKKYFFSMLVATLLSSGCSSLNVNDSTLAMGVVRKGDGVYSVKGTAFIDPAEKAVEQCKLDGNKRMSIMANTFELGVISGKQHPVLIFRCD